MSLKLELNFWDWILSIRQFWYTNTNESSLLVYNQRIILSSSWWQISTDGVVLVEDSKLLNTQGQSFGAFTRMLVFRANGAEPRTSLSLISGWCEHFLISSFPGRNVLGQKKIDIKACIPICSDHDNWNDLFKVAQQLLNKDMMSKDWKPEFNSSKSNWGLSIDIISGWTVGADQTFTIWW